MASLLTGSLADYLVPTAGDFPKIRGVVMESHPSPINPLGAKGGGEGGIISVGGVIANAVADALSVLWAPSRASCRCRRSRVWQLHARRAQVTLRLAPSQRSVLH